MFGESRQSKMYCEIKIKSKKFLFANSSLKVK